MEVVKYGQYAIKNTKMLFRKVVVKLVVNKKRIL